MLKRKLDYDDGELATNIVIYDKNDLDNHIKNAYKKQQDIREKSIKEFDRKSIAFWGGVYSQLF